MSGTDYRPRRARVVIGFAESLAAPEVVSSLADAGFEVVAFSRAGHRCAVRYDRRVTVVDVPAPETSVAATLDALARLFETADIVMPLDDAAVFLVDEVTRDTKIPVAGPTGKQARVALDKRVQVGLAAAAGLPVAAWTDVDLGAGLPDGWEPPFMLKPALASEVHEGALRRLSPRRVDSLDEFAELRQAWGDDADVFAQTLVSGVGEGVFGLASPAGIDHLSAHQRIRMMNPAGSGSSACHSIPVTDDLVGPVERVPPVGRVARDAHGRVAPRPRRHAVVHGAQRPAVGEPRARPPARLRVSGLGGRTGPRSERHLAGRARVPGADGSASGAGDPALRVRHARPEGRTRATVADARGDGARALAQNAEHRLVQLVAVQQARILRRHALHRSRRVAGLMNKPRAAVHVHSSWSYDAKIELEDLAAAFRKHHYDVVFMCEHDRGFTRERFAEYSRACADASTPDLLLVPGIEYADPEDRVHVPVWGDVPFLGEGLPTTDLLAEVRKHQGVALLAHPRRRDAWSVVDPAWFASFTAIEIWTRKWDGWAPNPVAVDAAATEHLVPIVSLDLHRMNQFFPLSMELTLREAQSPAECVDALRRGDCRPVFERFPVLPFSSGVGGAALRGVEKARAPVAARVRKILDARGR